MNLFCGSARPAPPLDESGLPQSAAPDLTTNAYPVHPKTLCAQSSFQFGLTSLWGIPALIILLCVISGCTAKIVALPYRSLKDYANVLKTDDLNIGVAVVDAPAHGHPVFNRPFQERGLLAVSVTLSNRSNDLIALSRGDIVLERPDGNRLVALERGEAATIMAGEVRNKLYRVFLLSDVFSGYIVYGLPETLLVDRGTEVTGYAFFDVGDQHVVSGTMSLAIRYSRLTVTERAQHSLRLK